jgi:hypothetical protein
VRVSRLRRSKSLTAATDPPDESEGQSEVEIPPAARVDGVDWPVTRIRIQVNRRPDRRVLHSDDLSVDTNHDWAEDRKNADGKTTYEISASTNFF